MSKKGAMLQVQVTVPSYFVCPISLELMRDPVTLSSGQTFDRSSIEKWLDDGHTTCPVTWQPIDWEQEEPIPNHALRRMLQAWCVQHKSFGVERIHTPRQPPSLKDIPLLVDHLAPRSGFDSLDALQKLTSLAFGRPLSRRNILQAGALSHLSKLLSRSYIGLAPLSSSIASIPTLSTADEALKLLDLLTDSDQYSAGVDYQRHECNEELIMSLTNTLVRTNNAHSRLKAASILMRLQPSDCLKRKMGEMQGFMASLVGMITEEGLSSKAAILELLLDVCSVSNRNRVLAMEVGAMDALADLLVTSQGSDKATMELTLKALEALCQCAEGRAAAASDVRMLVVVVKQMTAVSERATHHAIHLVLLVVKWAPESSKLKSLVVQEGALMKAIAVAQSAAASDTKLAALKLAVSLSEAVPPSYLSHTMML